MRVVKRDESIMVFHEVPFHGSGDKRTPMQNCMLEHISKRRAVVEILKTKGGAVFGCSCTWRSAASQMGYDDTHRPWAQKQEIFRNLGARSASRRSLVAIFGALKRKERCRMKLQQDKRMTFPERLQSVGMALSSRLGQSASRNF